MMKWTGHVKALRDEKNIEDFIGKFFKKATTFNV
jgi:ribosomal protein L31